MCKNQDPEPGSGPGMNIPDHISKSIETIFWVKIIKFFDADPESENLFDPGSGMEKDRIWDGKRSDLGWKKIGSEKKNPGFAALG
jgi:hypothetical protein